eukprot:scaffold284936_cov22-Prasinocladus_malaysianus.AAC.1
MARFHFPFPFPSHAYGTNRKFLLLITHQKNIWALIQLVLPSVVDLSGCDDDLLDHRVPPLEINVAHIYVDTQQTDRQSVSTTARQLAKAL